MKVDIEYVTLCDWNHSIAQPRGVLKEAMDGLTLTIPFLLTEVGHQIE